MDLNTAIKNSREIIESPFHSFLDLENNFNQKNAENNFKVDEVGLSKLKDWYFDESGNFVHKTGRFFKVVKVKNKLVNSGILLQKEIGTLGVVSCVYDDVLYILVQFKKEPGNIVSAQLSPTLQATLSNQNKVHGGSAPKYLELFQNLDKKEILFNAQLPEQGNRYWRKFNNNIVILKDYFEEDENYFWMTLGQVYEFKKFDNSINSCLRSVLSLITEDVKDRQINTKLSSKIRNFKDKAEIDNSVIEFYSKKDDELIFKSNNDRFHIKGISISIQDREVNSWDQPIIYDPYIKEYIILSIVNEKERKYLLKEYYEPGYEIGFNFGPTAISKSDTSDNSLKEIKRLFDKNANLKLIHSIEMSEEGGRFLHCKVKHSFYELITDASLKFPDNYHLYNMDEINSMNKNKLLSMEARSLIFFAKNIYN